MKFRGGIILFTLILNINGIALANEPTNSKIGITFIKMTLLAKSYQCKKSLNPLRKVQNKPLL